MGSTPHWKKPLARMVPIGNSARLKGSLGVGGTSVCGASPRNIPALGKTSASFPRTGQTGEKLGSLWLKYRLLPIHERHWLALYSVPCPWHPQDEDKPEDEMAQKRASLLERQQRRAEEARRRKQWQEAEKEQRREEALR